ncbi:hypothetical protein CAPTEDRAFT_98913 [Capitella teleta]|uniref:G-protein coupled receptors family 1 profile domain-containing protein n=1 Tax=Capitella teleta TaxID=283909 RepID=R7TPK0_CAPTE|nr:hypothetical protein CAPTEDRAFT_98913 [Capitella teleta]|eukprot:ELT92975.1 hypothetical protein CAPTEDRAFT_98913 [Capitella teleta]
MYLGVGVVGMIGNLMVIVVILSSHRMRRTTTNKFICSQSALDFFASFFVAFTSFFRNPGNIPPGILQELFCRFWLTNWPLWSVFVSSTYNLVAMTFERYVAIVYPLQHGRIVTKRKTYIAIALVWCVGPLWLTAYAVSSSTVKGGVCTVYSEWPSEFVRKLVSVVTLLLQYLTPICSITFAYIHIFVTLNRKTDKGLDAGNDKRNERMSKARRNVIKTLVQVFAVFVFCWSWNQIYFAFFNFGYPLNLRSTFYQFTVLFVFANSCMNPFVYTFNYDQFKKVQRQMFCPCLKQTSQSSDSDSVTRNATERNSQTTLCDSVSNLSHGQLPSQTSPQQIGSGNTVM